MQAFLTRTNNQEVTSVALHSPSTPGSTSPAVLQVPCPALEDSSTIFTHAQYVQEAVLGLKANAAPAPGPQPCNAAVVLDNAHAANEQAAAGGLGLALLVANNSTLHLVYKTTAYAQEAATLIACHLMVRMSCARAMSTARLH